MESELTCRLLPFEVGSGAWNMASDEAMLQTAIHGRASLRFYGWEEPTLSLGYFQPASVRLSNSQWLTLPWVRRPTGGDAILHHHEVTYCLTVPAGKEWQSNQPWLRMHAIIAEALSGLGAKAFPNEVKVPAGEDEPLCFHRFAPGDLLLGQSPHKIVGSAQRKRRGALLQHGSILLRRSEFAPSLPGIEDLLGRGIEADALVASIQRILTRETGWQLRSGEWTSSELEERTRFTKGRYSQDSWNRKR